MINIPDSDVGKLVKIDDTDLLIELSDRAPKTLPHFLIKSKNIFHDGVYRSVHYLLDHVGSDLEYLLVVNSFNDVYDCKLFSRPEWFTPSHRKSLQEGDYGWLFEYDNYPEEIYNEDIIFKRKVAHEVFGNVAIIEWETDESIVNYQLMLIESGIYNQGGGLVEFYEGRIIHSDCVSF